MSTITDFATSIQTGYTYKGKSLPLGGAMYGGSVVPTVSIGIPLSTMNRHGLIAGATGTGKTKTLQHIVESLSDAGVPTVIMDIKWDVSGLAMAGTTNEKVSTRLSMLWKSVDTWKGTWYPTEFFALGNTGEVRMRTTIAEYGPILFARLLELNDTQASVISVIFRYCDDMGMLLLDLGDMRKVLQYISGEWKEEIEGMYGAVSPATVSVIMRKIIEIEGQGADIFFGEPSFDVQDFVRTDDEWKGYVNILRLMDMVSRPKLFSTFMLSLLTEIYGTFPEEGDMEKPKMVLIIDEAHLLFADAPKSLLDQMEMVIKLIRSKGVGIFFCTQNPIDIPPSILAQLGLKVQHALRAFTANDRDAIRKASQNFPESTYYTVEDNLTTLGIGEAFVTCLDERGVPTPLVHTMVLPPQSRMDTLTPTELSSMLSISPLVPKYNRDVDRESADELIAKRISEKLAAAQAEVARIEAERVSAEPSMLGSIGGGIWKSILKSLGGELGRSVGKSLGGGRIGANIGGQVVRGLLGALFGGK